MAELVFVESLNFDLCPHQVALIQRGCLNKPKPLLENTADELSIVPPANPILLRDRITLELKLAVDAIGHVHHKQKLTELTKPDI